MLLFPLPFTFFLFVVRSDPLSRSDRCHAMRASPICRLRPRSRKWSRRVRATPRRRFVQPLVSNRRTSRHVPFASMSCSVPFFVGLQLHHQRRSLETEQRRRSCLVAFRGVERGSNEIALDPRHVLDEIDRFHCSALPSRVPNVRKFARRAKSRRRSLA